MTRVLHVVESLGRGAVEGWLLRMLSHARDRSLLADWTFYSVHPESSTRDAEARELGAGVRHSRAPLRSTGAFIQGLREEMRSGGYQVLHCHHDLVSGVYLAAALGMPLRRRVVHVHNADENLPTSNPIKLALLRAPLRQICLTAADRVVGISEHTLDTFLAGRRRRDGRDLVHYYGIDASPFRATIDRTAIRKSIGVSPDARVLLFAGRMVPEKNPLFAVDVLEAMRDHDPSVIGVFAGAGSMEDVVRQRVQALDLGASVRLLGWRDNLAALMMASDWFILPHPEKPMEGFGMAVVEAQLAGLRLLLSTGIPTDPLLTSAVAARLPLADGPTAWAQAAQRLWAQSPSTTTALRALAESPMDMDRAWAALEKLYQ